MQAVKDGCLLFGDEVAIFHPFGNTHFYRHGFHSWSLTSWIPLDLNLPRPGIGRLWPQVDHPRLMAAYPFAGSGVGALQGPDGKILLLGALNLDAVITGDRWTLVGTVETERTDMIPTQFASEKPPAAWLLTYGEENEVFNQYADRLVDLRGGLKQPVSPRVWCSWYSFYTRINQDDLIGVLDGLPGLPFDVFQVDDGWQICMGDWEPNEKFPEGMTYLAEKIRGTGLIPGLWFAPFIVQPSSSLLQRHPEWMLRDDNGELVIAGNNWGSAFYALDTTHPAVCGWLTDLIQKVRSWGYDYLKLDFLYAAALPGIRHKGLAGEQAYRQGLSILRQAAGEAFVLVCGAPVLASLGLTDGMRIGPDVATFWDNVDRSLYLHDLSGPSTLNAIRTVIHRLWLRPLVHTDPDVAFFRSRENLLDATQKQLLQNLVQIAGYLATSDPPNWLDSKERQEMISFFSEQPGVKKLSRYRYTLGDREVDFSFLEKAWPA